MGFLETAKQEAKWGAGAMVAASAVTIFIQGKLSGGDLIDLAAITAIGNMLFAILGIIYDKVNED